MVNNSQPHRPLAGFRVLDLSNVLAGPFCAHQLAHLGAEVIKIERPGSGDLARQLGADAALNASSMGVSFLAQNSGKRSLTLDLKQPAAQAVFHRLLATADVLVENFRPGVMDRLGLGFEALRPDHPELIYCAISGFGQQGPLNHLPAYDQIIQGMAGVMSVTGDADSAPLRVGYPMADTIGGLTAAFAISAALARTGPGRGCFIDVSMLDSVLATMGWVVSNYLVAGKVPEPMGNDNFTASPSGSFKVQDGLINIAANKQEQFAALCHVLGLPELIDDERFATREARLKNRHALATVMESVMLGDTARHWIEALNGAGVPAGPVLDLPSVLAHDQIRQRETLGHFDAVEGIDRPLTLARTGLRIDDTAPCTDFPPAQLGADTDKLLAELGFSRTEIDLLHEKKAV